MLPCARLSYALTFLAAAALIPAAHTAPPVGLINDVERHVTMDQVPLPAHVSETTAVAPGHVLQTEDGEAEVLLTPGVFVRLTAQSALKLDSATSTGVRVELLHGEALVEVIDINPKNRLEIVDKTAYTHLLSDGIYEFNADHPAILVYDGKARVEDDRRGVTVKTGQEAIPHGSAPLQEQKFDRREPDALYAWSEQRAEEAARTSESTIENLLALDRNTKYDSGWYWNPWFQAWAFVPNAGYRLSPFGYGFYAPDRIQNRAPIFESFRP